MERKGYRVWNSKKIEVLDSRDVIFYEDSLLKRNLDHSKLIGFGFPKEVVDAQRIEQNDIEENTDIGEEQREVVELEMESDSNVRNERLKV